MTRTYQLTGWCFGCLAAVLVFVSLLAVPGQPALADGPGGPPVGPDCPNQCSCSTPLGTPCYDGRCAPAMLDCNTQCGCTGSDNGGACNCVN